ncbi:D-isomer specific 2-hydroxyacid dehydrogenase family protein [Corynebacterium choanae]|uniref:Glyoxylate/hydroxypyruvate reductase B n=1 Tax=Corynebacterium choanae TaxID=1862358 RepID=A0A3G6J7L9_9CORY|nr:D-isomer specific 2-hydroxyacid dehydrogenase family protein [Corynebacterium choanae]AZA14111.1 Glyoxylate/hydroxypyruvate reductase B [Corynebacterium choanae]
MKYAITPKPWDVVIETLDAEGHTQVELHDDPELVIYNGTADQFPKLGESVKWVQLTLAGIDAFFDRGIITPDRRWTNASGVYARPVAESAVALLLGALHLYPDALRRQQWDTSGYIDKHSRWLYDSEVLIIGAGGIGKELIPMLQGFGCKVTGVNRSGNPVAGADRTVPFSELDTVLGEADHVILAAPLTAETHHLVDAEFLGKMKSSAVFVNVGRGPQVVTDDLVAALEQGTIWAAALDVTDPEPLPDGHPLFAMNNVLITPHVANTVSNIPRLISTAIVDNIRAYTNGETMPTEVDPARGY